MAIIKPHECGFWGSRNTRVMVFGPGNQAKNHHGCVSAPSEITRVWFYIYPMPQKLPKTTFNSGIPTPSSPWRRDDVTPTELRHHVDLSNNMQIQNSNSNSNKFIESLQMITFISEKKTINCARCKRKIEGKTSLRIPDDTDATEEIRIMLYLIF
jgi:hypothetical protein